MPVESGLFYTYVGIVWCYIPIVMKSGNLNFLEPSGPLQACNGTALPFYRLVLIALSCMFCYTRSNYKMYFLIFCTTFVWNVFILRRIQQDIIHVNLSSSKVPVNYSCQISMTLEYSRQNLGGNKIFKYQISWKSFQWEPSCSMRTGRWADKTKLIVAFHCFAKAPSIWLHIPANSTFQSQRR